MNKDIVSIKKYFEAEYKKDRQTIKAIVSNKPINGYIGWTGYGNLGDEAIYESYQKLFPGSNFTEFRMGRPAKLFTALLGREIPFGYVALGGGTLINQSKDYLTQTQDIVKRDIPMFCLGTGVAAREFWKDHENVHTANDIEEWVRLLNKFIYVGVRGPLSQKRLADTGFNAEVVGDAALTLASETYRKRTGRTIVGLNISLGADNAMWGNPDLFKKEILLSVKELIKNGFEIRILPIWKDDLELSQYIGDQINDPACQIIVAYDTVSEYLQELDKCDLFIGLKLHATVLATMLRIPSIMLEYEPKCLDYMESINMGEYSIRTDRVTPSVLSEKLQKLIKNYEGVVEVLDERVLHYKVLQKSKASYILKKLHEREIID